MELEAEEAINEVDFTLGIFGALDLVLDIVFLKALRIHNRNNKVAIMIRSGYLLATIFDTVLIFYDGIFKSSI